MCVKASALWGLNNDKPILLSLIWPDQRIAYCSPTDWTGQIRFWPPLAYFMNNFFVNWFCWLIGCLCNSQITNLPAVVYFLCKSVESIELYWFAYELRYIWRRLYFATVTVRTVASVARTTRAPTVAHGDTAAARTSTVVTASAAQRAVSRVSAIYICTFVCRRAVK